MAGMDVTAFTFSAIMLTMTLLVIFMTDAHTHHGVSIDLPKTLHPQSMWRAQLEDALVVGILRNGDIFFGNDKIGADTLSEKISERIRSEGGERRVYIRADGRARWGRVGEVIDQVRAARIPQVGFLAEQRKQ